MARRPNIKMASLLIKRTVFSPTTLANPFGLSLRDLSYLKQAKTFNTYSIDQQSLFFNLQKICSSFPVISNRPLGQMEYKVTGCGDGHVIDHLRILGELTVSLPKDGCLYDQAVTSPESESTSTPADLTEQSISPLPNIPQNCNSNIQALFEIFEELEILTDSADYFPHGQRPEDTGIYCKNLLLKDRRNQYYFLVCDENFDVDLKLLRKKLGAYRNFSFGSPSEIDFLLRLVPGSLSPFALFHGSSRSVRVVMSKELTLDPDAILNFHPLDPRYTTRITYGDLVKFLEYCNHSLEIVEL